MQANLDAVKTVRLSFEPLVYHCRSNTIGLVGRLFMVQNAEIDRGLPPRPFFVCPMKKQAKTIDLSGNMVEMYRQPQLSALTW